MRCVAWPTVLRGVMPSLPRSMARPTGSHHRFNVVVVIRAAAQIAGHRCPNFIARRMRILHQQRLGDHQLPGGAVAALRRVMLDEGFLQRIELAVLGQPFHRLDRAAVHPHGQLAARIQRRAVHQNGAGAALAAIAADLGARELQVVAQQLDQGPAVLHFHAAIHAVDGDLDRGPGNAWMERWRPVLFVGLRQPVSPQRQRFRHWCLRRTFAARSSS